MTRLSQKLAAILAGMVFLAGFAMPASAQSGTKIVRSAPFTPFFLEKGSNVATASVYNFLNPFFHSTLYLQLQVVPSGATTNFSVHVKTRDGSSAPGAGNGTTAVFCSLQAIGPSDSKVEGGTGATGISMKGDAANSNMVVCPDLVGPVVEIAVDSGFGIGTATTYDFVATILPSSMGAERVVRGPYTVGQTISTTSGQQGSPVMLGGVNASNIVRYIALDANNNIIVSCSTGTNACQVQGNAAAGSPPVGNPVQTGGTDGTNMRTVLLDNAGRPQAVTSASAGDATSGGNQGFLPTSASTSTPLSVYAMGWNGTSNNMVPSCELSAILNSVGAATSQIVALAGGQRVRICSVIVSNSSATASNWKLVQGTGTNCVTGQSDLTTLVVLDGVSATSGTADAWSTTFPMAGLRTAAGNAVCVTGSAAGSLNTQVTYSQY